MSSQVGDSSRVGDSSPTPARTSLTSPDVLKGDASSSRTLVKSSRESAMVGIVSLSSVGELRFKEASAKISTSNRRVQGYGKAQVADVSEDSKVW